jgi:hypothetical protein
VIVMVCWKLDSPLQQVAVVTDAFMTCIAHDLSDFCKSKILIIASCIKDPIRPGLMGLKGVLSRRHVVFGLRRLMSRSFPSHSPKHRTFQAMCTNILTFSYW